MSDRYEIMHLIVMFDLPTESKQDKKEYADFRKLLINNGFYMLQFSIYVRFCLDKDYVKKYEKVIKNNVPHNGSIRCIAVTNKQFNDMPLLLGEKRPEETVQTYEQLTLL